METDQSLQINLVYCPCKLMQIINTGNNDPMTGWKKLLDPGETPGSAKLVASYEKKLPAVVRKIITGIVLKQNE
jgi:hypothetical protein